MINLSPAMLERDIREAAQQTPIVRRALDRHRVTEAQLSLGVVGLHALRQCAEGYFGAAAYREKARELKQLRAENPNAYHAIKEQVAHHSEALFENPQLLRIAETLTTSDVATVIGSLRYDYEAEDNRPDFRTDLMRITRQRTRTELGQYRVAGGVRLRRKLLTVRPEGTANIHNSWEQDVSTYSIENFQDGFELTWEAYNTAERTGDWLEALRELAQNAARTRAAVIIDAIRSAANVIDLNNANGPTIENVKAIDDLLGQMQINGVSYSRRLTDIFVPTKWRGVARDAMTTSSIIYTGGSNGPLEARSSSNPMYGRNAWEETAMTDTPLTSEQSARGVGLFDWIAADADAKPVELGVFSGYENGAVFMVKIGEVRNLQAPPISYDSHLIEVKVSDLIGATVRDRSAVVIVGDGA